jgi:predicted esterase
MTGVHQGQPVLKQGQPLSEAKAAMVMLHGRGGGVESIVPLIHHFDSKDFAYLVPAAADRTWYPERFLVPRENNEPYLTSALQAVGDVVAEITAAGIPTEKIMLLGFSQGACLALEYAARHPQAYGGVVALSGGLIGADDELNGYVGSLAGTSVFIGCSDEDFHIPENRVHQTAEIMKSLGADVEERIYPGMGHTINEDELVAVIGLMSRLV